ncbi:MAG: haloacid dehalogenase type II [Chloroflexi bacterium]|nr:haloacid dehalogenase type II [Chloroflexota bacterium]
MLDFDRFQWISFDCYGTLVDWETGIVEAVSEVLTPRSIYKSRAEILALFADVEPRVQRAGYLEYRHVLLRVMAQIGSELGFQPTESELACLADSLPHWPVFPDTVDALRALQSRFRLAVISNVDDDLFTGTAAALGIDFDAVVTAQQVRSYKPGLDNFHAAAARMAVATDAWLHVAESLYHDIAPANQLGIASVWVNRSNRGGGTRRVDAVPDFVVPDLATLAQKMCRRDRRPAPAPDNH